MFKRFCKRIYRVAKMSLYPYLLTYLPCTQCMLWVIVKLKGNVGSTPTICTYTFCVLVHCAQYTLCTYRRILQVRQGYTDVLATLCNGTYFVCEYWQLMQENNVDGITILSVQGRAVISCLSLKYCNVQSYY